MHSQHAAEHKEPGSILKDIHEEHAAIANSVRDLARAAHLGDAAAMVIAFGEVDRKICHHLACGDDELLPRLVDCEPSEVAVLMEQHARIHRQLDDLGLALDLHALRAGMVDDFLELVSEHAVCEEHVVFDWAKRTVPAAEQHALFNWVMGRLEERFSHRP
jgi:hypothetical protein